MTAPTRRMAIGTFMGVGAACALGPSIASAGAGVAFPTDPMRLERVQERSLRGDAMIRVERSWRVSFTKQGQGIAISGVQLSAKVDAPEQLAPLARIEETRSTDDMWPILLSDTGRILAAGTETREEDLAAAVREAEKTITQRGRPAAEQAEQRRYLAEMQRAGSSLLDRLPEDLFFPVGEPRRAVQTLDLPGGQTGQFEVNYTAMCAKNGAWLDRAVREIVTRIGSEEQRAREEWILSET